MRLADPYRDGQRPPFEAAMTVVCPHCHAGYYRQGGTNDIRRDVAWLNGDMLSGIHVVDGKRRKCRAAKLIPLYAIIPGVGLTDDGGR